MAMFQGFTEDQTKKIATKLGFQGPIENLNEFLASNPAAAASFGRMSEKARMIAEGRTKRFNDGGLVTYTETGQTGVTNPANTSNPASPSTPEEGSVVPFSKTSDETKTTVQNQLTSPTANVPSGAMAQTSTITPQSNQFIPQGTGQISSQAPGVTASTPAAVSTNQNAATYQTATTANQINQAASQNQAAQTSVDQNSQVQAQTQDPNTVAQLNLQAPQISEADKKEATVQQQLTNLMKDFEGGKTPPWAAGVLRNVNAQMAARGLDASSVAGQAAVQAAMEAATAIAATDAQLLSTTNLANLDVRKSKMLSDAAAMSAMELTNLNNRQQAAVQNAQAFLQTNFKNLDVKAQTDALNFQARVNGLLSDQAQENAARQFNATSENQTQQFFANLSANVDVQRAEMQNDIGKFNASLQTQRDQFNAQNALVIEQANAAWRQQITTANNAAQNLTNQLNAQTVARMNENAFNAMIQLERDEMNYINDALNRSFTGNENRLDRENRIIVESLARDATRELAKMGYEFESGSNVGKALFGIGGSILSAGLNNGWGSLFSW